MSKRRKKNKGRAGQVVKAWAGKKRQSELEQAAQRAVWDLSMGLIAVLVETMKLSMEDADQLIGLGIKRGMEFRDQPQALEEFVSKYKESKNASTEDHSESS